MGAESRKTRHRICLKPLVIIDSPFDTRGADQNNAKGTLIQRYIFGQSYEKRPIRGILAGEGEDSVLIMASVHGDETAGAALVRRLAQYLRKYPNILDGRKVLLLPMVNPDGRTRNSRYNARGVDINRNFATSNRRKSRRHGFCALSEPETRAIVRAIRKSAPRRVITIHQPLACIDYDGPGKALARHISRYCNLPVRKLGAMPGSLGSYTGVDMGIPTITFELPGNLQRLSPEDIWYQYGPALIASILYPTGAQKGVL